jgi:hypothetical protein
MQDDTSPSVDAFLPGVPHATRKRMQVRTKRRGMTAMGRGRGIRSRKTKEVLERGVEDERKEADDADDDTNVETGPDLDSGSNDDSGFSTELDSDSDFNFECTFNLRRSRFALYA